MERRNATVKTVANIALFKEYDEITSNSLAQKPN
jgi:hypothetical protein